MNEIGPNPEYWNEQEWNLDAIYKEPWAAVYLALPDQLNSEEVRYVHAVAERCYWAAQYRIDNPDWKGSDMLEPSPEYGSRLQALEEHAQAALSCVEEMEDRDIPLQRMGLEIYENVVCGMKGAPEAQERAEEWKANMDSLVQTLHEVNYSRGGGYVTQADAALEDFQHRQAQRATTLDGAPLADHQRPSELSPTMTEASQELQDHVWLRSHDDKSSDVEHTKDAGLTDVRGGHEDSDERSGDDLDRQHQMPGGRKM